MDHRSWWTRESGAIAPAILGFFARYLKDAAPGEVTSPRRGRRTRPICLHANGPGRDSIGGETVYSINRERAARILTAKKTVASRADLERLETRLRSDVRTLTAAVAAPGSKPRL